MTDNPQALTALIIGLVALVQIVVELLRRFVFKTYGEHDSQSHAVILRKIDDLAVGQGKLRGGCDRMSAEVKRLVDEELRRQRFLDKAAEHMREVEERDVLMAHRVEELHGWHDHDDPDEPGVKIWWTRRSLAKAIERLAVTAQASTEATRELTRVIRSRIPKNGGA